MSISTGINITLQERITMIYLTSEFHAMNTLAAKLHNRIANKEKQDAFYHRLQVTQRQLLNEIQVLCHYCLSSWNLPNFPFNISQERTEIFGNIYTSILVEGEDYILNLEKHKSEYYQINKHLVGRDTILWFERMVLMRSNSRNGEHVWDKNSPSLQVMQHLPAFYKTVTDFIGSYKEHPNYSILDKVVGNQFIDLLVDYTLLSKEELTHLQVNVISIIENRNPTLVGEIDDYLGEGKPYDNGVADSKLIVYTYLATYREKKRNWNEPLFSGVLVMWLNQIILKTLATLDSFITTEEIEFSKE